jgi:hypothetical protein
VAKVMSKKVTQPNLTNCKKATIVVGRDWYIRNVGETIFVKESGLFPHLWLAFDETTGAFRQVMKADVKLIE